MNNRSLGAAAVFAALAVARAAQAAAAADVPKGDQQVTLNGNRYVSTDLSTPLSIMQSGSPFGSAGASAAGTPIVSAVANTGAGIASNVATRAGLDYYIKLDGPSFDGPVPIYYKSLLQIVSAGFDPGESSSATAQFILQSYSTYSDGTPYQNLTNYTWTLTGQSAVGYAPIIADKVVTGDFQLAVGDLLAAGIVADVSAEDGGQATASADPYFFIDPTFAADHPEYTLSFSPFAGNDPVSSAPEPTTWALMMLGIGAVGFSVRQRGRKDRMLARV